MKNKFLIICLITVLCGCKTNIIEPTDNITGKIKSIISSSSISSYGDTIRFRYNTNGTLDYITFNDLSIAQDSFITAMQSNGYINRMSRYRDVGFPILDSLWFTFNPQGYIENLNDIYKEASNIGRLAMDTSSYDSDNLIKYVRGWDGFGDTPGSHRWGREECTFTYDDSKVNSLTNENIGMPDFGKISHNPVDSINIKSYEYSYFSNRSDSFAFKVYNIYDNQGRIIKTNFIPYLGFISLLRNYSNSIYSIYFQSLVRDYDIEYY